MGRAAARAPLPPVASPSHGSLRVASCTAAARPPRRGRKEVEARLGLFEEGSRGGGAPGGKRANTQSVHAASEGASEGAENEGSGVFIYIFLSSSSISVSVIGTRPATDAGCRPSPVSDCIVELYVLGAETARVWNGGSFLPWPPCLSKRREGKGGREARDVCHGCSDNDDLIRRGDDVL